jgi:hypothetical protein
MCLNFTWTVLGFVWGSRPLGRRVAENSRLCISAMVQLDNERMVGQHWTVLQVQYKHAEIALQDNEYSAICKSSALPLASPKQRPQLLLYVALPPAVPQL